MIPSDMEKLGLTLNESKVYLALLELGSINAGPIIRKTGLHRNIVYDNIDRLIEKGLVGFIIKNNRKYFEAAQTQQILSWISKEKEDVLSKEALAEKFLPEIEGLRKLSREKKEAMVLSGVKSVTGLAMEMVEEGDFDMFATGYGMRTNFPVQFKKFNNRIKERGKRVRAIITEKMRHEDQGTPTARFLSEHFMLPVNTSILKDKVNIFIWEKDPLAIQIRSKDVADAYRVYFNCMWKLAKK